MKQLRLFEGVPVGLAKRKVHHADCGRLYTKPTDRERHGFSLAYDIIKAHGGDLTVDTK
jgi:hypothetical protein